MGIFSKRREREAAEKAQRDAENAYEEMVKEMSKPWCQQKGHHHEYRDFPPYMTYRWNGERQQGDIFIKEKYVCIYCHNVETKILGEWNYTNYKHEDFDKEVERITKTYAEILKPRVIVEDMINDAIMVDRQKLAIWDKLHAPEPPKKEEKKYELKVGRDIVAAIPPFDPGVLQASRRI